VTEQPRSPAFVGRDDELTQLVHGLDDVAAGRGRLVLIGGEPGIGKTRLADELAARARDRGFLVAWGRAWEDAGAPAFWPWVQVLRACLRDENREGLREHLGAGIADLGRILPELAPSVVPDTEPEPASDSARFRLFDTVADFLARAGDAGPVLVLLDDLQAADVPSLLLLKFVASQLQRMRVMVVSAYRSGAAVPGSALASAVDDLEREPSSRSLFLSGLGAAGVQSLVASVTGQSLDSDLITTISQRTDGNPLFIAEVAKLLAEEGDLAPGGDLRTLPMRLPAGIQGLMRRRIGTLGTAGIQALVTAAAIGPEFSVRDVAEVTGEDAEAVSSTLARAVHAGFILPVAGPEERMRFAHDLVREALYQSVSLPELAAIHRGIAMTVRRGSERTGAATEAELAFHFYQAAANGDGPEQADLARDAARHAVNAGDQAVRSLGYEEAARLYRIALDAQDLVPATPVAERAEILLSLGDALARAGELDAARTTFLDVAALAEASGMPGPLCRAALGYGGRFPWARAGDDQHLVPLLRRALEAASDPPLRIRLLGRLACALRGLPGQREVSDDLSREALQLARRLGDLPTLSYALTCRYWAIWWPENPSERLGIAEEALAVARSGGDPEQIIDAYQMRYQTYVDLGRMADARIDNETVRHLARELRQPAQLWLARGASVLVALATGDYELAERVIPSELAPRPSNPVRDDLSAAITHRFLWQREKGRVAEEEDSVRRAAMAFPWYPLHRAALACLLAEVGRKDEARSVLDELARDAFAVFERDSEWLLGICLASEAASLLGDGASAAVLYAQLKSSAGQNAVGHAEGSVGAVDRYLGLLARVTGEFEAAESHLSNAIAVNTRMGLTPWAAHAMADLASLLRERGRAQDRARADELARSARSIASRIGMTTLEAQLAGSGDARREVIPSPVSRHAAFRREGEYWSVTFGDDAMQLRDTKGMGYLAQLLARPGQETHVLDLVRSTSTGSGSVPSVTAADLGGGGFSSAFDDTGDLLDPAARAAYRARLAELDAEVAEAEAWNDEERARRARAERGFLVDELAAAVGMGGRGRSAPSGIERARISVSKAVHAAMRRIESHSAGLGSHLSHTVHTGVFCSYTPDPALGIVWDTGQ
jgi:tetratricopeptide (TPR) repeat protein